MSSIFLEVVIYIYICIKKNTIINIIVRLIALVIFNVGFKTLSIDGSSTQLI